MYTLKKGWTRQRVMEQFKKYNNGTRAHSGLDCVYMTPNGNRCAVGAFIPDDHAGLRLYGTAMLLLGQYPGLLEFMPFDDVAALTAMQRAHDQCRNDQGDSGDTYAAMAHFLETQVQEVA